MVLDKCTSSNYKVWSKGEGVVEENQYKNFGGFYKQILYIYYPIGQHSFTLPSTTAKRTSIFITKTIDVSRQGGKLGA